MEKIELGEVERQLAKVDREIAALRDEFWGSYDWNDKKVELEAKINARRDWKENLEAAKTTIVVMNNGGIEKDIESKVKDNRRKPINWVDLTRSEKETGFAD